ncbi:FecCD family ABC transporter permease [Arthrobacter sp. NIO-1057]|uniref:FecCD family ABC transporter permease n=1 Tax=Arthrobacter sp. NIO-1057 TaxID=993071 RepID=UPI00071C8B62|nr:iron chelate uptake ABC transporter family permease subunit [Arthrobacter sp. NIO-1057]KSU66077.1 iron ABC transporter permease [Arthrobacter sp. NIO-1057]SCC31530.1 iron complex transport system permease protein [Arthrobacter sp. NIO-1057]
MSVKTKLRAPSTVLVLLALCLLVSVFAISGGEYQMTPWQVLKVLFGQGEGIENMVIWQWRMPRAVAALLFGAALALSGAVFQSLTRNPLGSPDIIGFSTGAYTGALITLTVLGGGFVATSLGALTGGLLTALLVYLLAWRNGTAGFRLILVGIGISSVLASFNHFLVLRAELDVAMAAAVWGAGTLNGLTWQSVTPVGILVVLVSALLLASSSQLRMLQLGDDLCRALGMRVERTKLLLVVLAVFLVAAVTSLAGPIAFVALVAPQIARRLAGSAGLQLVPTALVGALLLASSDLLAQRLFAPVQLPVGVVTVCFGGLYLIYLLNRRTTKV